MAYKIRNSDATESHMKMKMNSHLMWYVHRMNVYFYFFLSQMQLWHGHWSMWNSNLGSWLATFALCLFFFRFLVRSLGFIIILEVDWLQKHPFRKQHKKKNKKLNEKERISEWISSYQQHPTAAAHNALCSAYLMWTHFKWEWEYFFFSFPLIFRIQYSLCTKMTCTHQMDCGQQICPTAKLTTHIKHAMFFFNLFLSQKKKTSTK